MNSRFLSRTPSITSFSRFLNRDPHARFFYSENTDPADPPKDPPAAPPAGKSVDELVEDKIAELLGKKNNDPMAAMNTLIRQNHRLEERAVAAEKSQLPKADRDLLTKFKALNVSVDDVTKIIGEHKTLSETAAKNAKLEGLKKVCEKAGYNPELIAQLSGALDNEYALIGEGEAAKPIAKVKNGDNVTDKDFDAFVAEQWPGLVDTLKAAPVTPGQKQKQVTPTHRGAPQGGGKAPTLAEKIRAEESATKGGLFGAPAAVEGQQQAPAVPMTLAERMNTKRS